VIVFEPNEAADTGKHDKQTTKTINKYIRARRMALPRFQKNFHYKVSVSNKQFLPDSVHRHEYAKTNRLLQDFSPRFILPVYKIGRPLLRDL
jgi:hypothetical protein